MIELGIILDFKDRMIIIDEIGLPMGNIDKLPSSNDEALRFNNWVANNIEPKSTQLITQCIVKIYIRCQICKVKSSSNF